MATFSRRTIIILTLVLVTAGLPVDAHHAEVCDASDGNDIGTDQPSPREEGFPFVCEGDVGSWGDVDAYAFTFPGGTLHAWLAGAGGLGNLTLLDDAGGEVAYKAEDDGLVHLEVRNLTEARYVLEVRGAGGTGYEVAATDEAVPPHAWKRDCGRNHDTAPGSTWDEGYLTTFTCRGWLHAGHGDTVDAVQLRFLREHPASVTVTTNTTATLRLTWEDKHHVEETNSKGERWVSHSGWKHRGSTEGTSTLELEGERVTWPRYNGQPLPERFLIELVDGTGLVGYEITVEAPRPDPHPDCGSGGDDNGGDPIDEGVACAGRLRDGVDDRDLLHLPADDGDIVNLTVDVRGQSYLLGVYGGYTFDGSDWTHREVVPVGETGHVEASLVAAGDEGTRLEVKGTLWKPELYEVCYFHTCTLQEGDLYDPHDHGPATYEVVAHVTPNHRPTLNVSEAPDWVFRGDIFDVDVAWGDRDGEHVTLHAWTSDGTDLTDGAESVAPNGSRTLTVDTLESGSWLRVYVDAEDAKGVPASRFPLESHVEVLPRDCDGRGDAPPEGRLFTGSCSGWVEDARDPGDDLLFDVADPNRRVSFDVQGQVHVHVTDPTGATRTVDVEDAVYHDFLAEPGRYVVNVTPKSGAAYYTVSSHVEPAAAPDGAVHLAPVGSSRVGDGALGADALVEVDDTVKHILSVPPELVANATGATLRLKAVATDCGAGWSGLDLYVNGNHRDLRPCLLWGTAEPTWASFELPASHLEPGENTVLLRNRRDGGEHVQVAVNSTLDTGRTTDGWFGDPVGGELLAHLDVRHLAADGVVDAGLQAGVVVDTEEPETYPANVSVDWDDGTGSEELVLAWGEERELLHAWPEPGTYAVEATGASTYDPAITLDAASLDVTRVEASDCGSGRDAHDAVGFVFFGTCAGSVGGTGDGADLLRFWADAGTHVRVTVEGDVSHELRAPFAGEDPVFVEGTAHDHAHEAGLYELTLASATGAAEPYDVTVELEPAEAPTGEVTVTGPQFTVLGNETTVHAVGSALDHEPVAYDVGWGDGSPVRVPGSGFLEFGEHEASASWTFGSPGAHEVTVEAWSNSGRNLTPGTAVVDVVVPDDCGAGEAPDGSSGDPLGLVLGAPPVPVPGRCWGTLTSGDVDRYEVDPGPVRNVVVVVHPDEGVGLDARLLLAPGGTGVAVEDGLLMPREEREDGSVVLRGYWFVGSASPFIVEVLSDGAPGAYEVEVRT